MSRRRSDFETLKMISNTIIPPSNDRRETIPMRDPKVFDRIAGKFVRRSRLSGRSVFHNRAKK